MSSSSTTGPKPLLEVAVASLVGARVAVEAGADRLELSSLLACGGLTPSVGLFRQVRRLVRVPVLVMLRPRAGGFVYTDDDLAVIKDDLQAFLEQGADGFVLGILTQQEAIDEARCRAIVEAAAGKPVVFHRAFDMTPRPERALETLIDLGIRRVLTSGQERTAWDGAILLRRLNEQARGRIEILPGAGVRPENVAGLLRATGCTQVHASCRLRTTDPSLRGHPWLELGAPGANEIEETDPVAVRVLREALDRYHENIAGSRTEA